MDVPVPPPSAAVYEVELHCSKDNSTTTGSIQFQAIPATAREVKRAIQSTYSIPTCVQRLSYQSTVLQDGDELDSSLRSGDTFHVTYMGRGEYREVEEGVKWMSELIGAMESTGEDSRDELDAVLLRGQIEGHDYNLSTELLVPWCTDVKYVNKLHFVAEKGLDALLKLYTLATSQPHDNMGGSNWCKAIENMCLSSITNFCGTQELQKLALQYGAQDRVRSSFLSTRLSGTPDDRIVSSETVSRALYTLCNLAEVSESQLPLAKDKEVLLQAVGICNSHAFPCMTAAVAAGLLLYVANTPATHPYLANPKRFRALEEGAQHIWCTFTPYINHLYTPQGGQEISDLHILSIKVLLIMLAVSFGQKVHQDILHKEGLLDYVLCLPSLVPLECQELSRDVVSELATHMLLEPPSLTNLARAKLAMPHLGLETVRRVSSVTELVHLLH